MRKSKSVVLIFLTGQGACHLDTFDLKPEAPVEIRGEFKTIATKAAWSCFLVNICRIWRRGPTSWPWFTR